MKKILLVLICLCLFISGCGEDTAQKEKAIDYSTATTQEIIDSMTLEEKVAQMFIVSCPTVDASIYAKQYQFGGYIFFGNHFKNSDPDTFRNNIENYQENSKIPMFISIDEEGGFVTRASRYSQFREKPFVSSQELYAQGGMDTIREDVRQKTAFLKDLGINLNFAPVCDVSQNPEDFIFERSIGLDAEGTSEYAKVVVEEMNTLSMGGALKHFPGYGNNADTHTGIAIDTRPIDQFRQRDFIPFKAGIKAGAPMVMVSHNIVECMDKTNPASLSPQAHRILREELGFEGVIITDDLSMGAIEEFSADVNPAVSAILAGNDMICLSGDFKPMISAVIGAVENGTITEEQIDESVARIIEYKRNLGLFK